MFLWNKMNQCKSILCVAIMILISNVASPSFGAITVTTGDTTVETVTEECTVSCPSIFNRSVELTGSFNPVGDTVTWYFEYGTADEESNVTYTKKTETQSASGSESLSISANIDSGLAENTTYHYRLVVKDSLNESQLGEDKTFTTTDDLVCITDIASHTLPQTQHQKDYNPQQFGYTIPSGKLGELSGLAVDSRGRVLAVSSSKKIVYVFTSDGKMLSTWGSTGSANGQFQSPSGIAIDIYGNIYIADKENHRIQKFDSNYNFLGKFGTNGAEDGQFSSPQGVAIDINGNIYVADTGNNRIQKFKSNYDYIDEWASTRPIDMEIYDGKIFVVSPKDFINGGTSSASNMSLMELL
ncbi:MAG: hypothetical protein HQK64_03245 [Desulfamplus sp.]|nr:hypothetical protein [Desulfamplus sp.]